MTEKQMTLQRWLMPGGGLSASLIQEVLAANRDKTDLEFVAAAKKAHYHEGTLEVDDTALVSRCDNRDGAYVQAWVWVEGYKASYPLCPL